MAEIRYDPACLPCRLAAGKPGAGAKRECHAHEVARLTRELEAARARLRDWDRAEQAWAARVEHAERERDAALASWQCQSCGARFGANLGPAAASAIDGVTRCSRCVEVEVLLEVARLLVAVLHGARPGGSHDDDEE